MKNELKHLLICLLQIKSVVEMYSCGMHEVLEVLVCSCDYASELGSKKITTKRDLTKNNTRSRPEFNSRPTQICFNRIK